MITNCQKPAKAAKIIAPIAPFTTYGFANPCSSLNIAAGLGLGGNESYPDLFQPYGGFPDGVKVEKGYVTLPDLPGLGFEGKADLYAEMRALAS